MNLTGRVQSDLKSFSKRPPAIRPARIPRTWIMIIDRHIVRIFEKNKEGLEPIGIALPDLAGKPEITNKSVGRVVNSSGDHHKYEPHMNESQQEDMSFVHQVSDWLDKAVWEDAFDRLILVAPPKTLGNFRKVMNQPVQTRIIAEINKDLTKLDDRALQEELKKLMWF